MYISIYVFVFIILGVKKKSVKAPSPSKACPRTHNLRYPLPTWFPLSSSTAQLPELSQSCQHQNMYYHHHPNPAHYTSTNSIHRQPSWQPIPLPASLLSSTKETADWSTGPSDWASDQVPTPVTCVHLFIHVFSPSTIPYIYHKHILFPACIVTGDKNTGSVSLWCFLIRGRHSQSSIFVTLIILLSLAVFRLSLIIF